MSSSPPRQEVFLLVLEAGVTWPAHLEEYQGIAPDSIVEAQVEGEEMGDFATRVIHKINRRRAQGMLIRVAAMVTNREVSQWTMRARYRVALAAAQAMDSDSNLVLTLGVPTAEYGSTEQHRLFELAGLLCDELSGTGVGISVRLGERDATRRSGTRPSVSATLPAGEPEGTGTDV